MITFKNKQTEVEKMKKIILLSALMLMSACSTQQNSDDTQSSEPEYKIYSLESGSTMIEIPEEKKAFDIGLRTRSYSPSMSTRNRATTDEYEQICLSRQKKADKDITLIACFNEKGYQPSTMNEVEKVFTKSEVSKGIERVSISQGLKIDHFTFDLDGAGKLEYTTRKMESYEEPESYMVIRLMANKNVWSGQKMLIIQEN
jgi:hypothetical protein